MLAVAPDSLPWIVRPQAPLDRQGKHLRADLPYPVGAYGRARRDRGVQPLGMFEFDRGDRHLAERGHDVVADHRSIVLLCVRGQLGDAFGIKASAQLGDRWRGTFRRLLANRIGAEIDIALDPLCHLARRCRRPVRKRADCRAPL